MEPQPGGAVLGTIGSFGLNIDMEPILQTIQGMLLNEGVLGLSGLGIWSRLRLWVHCPNIHSTP